MNFTIQTKILKEALMKASKISAKKNIVELYTMSYFVIRENKLDLITSNEYCTLTQEYEVTSSKDFNFFVETHKLKKVISTIKTTELNIELDENGITTINGNALTLPTFTHKFILPKHENKVEVKLETKDLLPAIEAALTSVGLPKNVYQPEFLGVAIVHNTDSIDIVGSDKFRLTLTNIKVDSIPEGETYIMPSKTAKLILNLYKSDNVTLSFGTDNMRITSGNITLLSDYQEGRFPDVRKILPTTFENTYKVNTSEFLNGLDAIKYVTDGNIINHTMQITVQPASNTILLSAKNDDEENASITIKMTEYTGIEEEFVENVNASFLRDYLKLVKTENVLFESTRGKPMVLSPENQKEKQVYLLAKLR